LYIFIEIFPKTLIGTAVLGRWLHIYLSVYMYNWYDHTHVIMYIGNTEQT